MRDFLLRRKLVVFLETHQAVSITCIGIVEYAADRQVYYQPHLRTKSLDQATSVRRPVTMPAPASRRSTRTSGPANVAVRANVSSSTSAAATATSASHTTSSAIETFLHAFCPPMDALATLFADAGVKTEEDLEGLIMMNDLDQRQFLAADLRLNAFQVRIICIGLSKQRNGLNGM